MLKYEIQGGNLPVVICYPQVGQTLCTESGSMSWMSPNIKMETNSGGGFKKAMGRFFSGDSIFLNEYTPQGCNGMIAFASSFPGTIIPFELRNGESIIVQKKGFLAMEKGLELSTYFQKKISTGFFGGEGFIMQKIKGDGVVFVEIDGFCKEYVLGVGQQIVIDTGYLAAMSETCQMDIQTVKGVKNMLFGGEGIFNTVITGPGKVYIQSMPISNTAAALAPFIAGTATGNGFNINFGD